LKPEFFNFSPAKGRSLEEAEGLKVGLTPPALRATSPWQGRNGLAVEFPCNPLLMRKKSQVLFCFQYISIFCPDLPTALFERYWG
jgi:hypothetical protein